MITRTLFAGLLLALAAEASAAPRTVCFSMKFREARDPNDRNSPSATEDGALRGKLPTDTPTDPIGHLYELWDRDDDGPDEYIGRWVKASAGVSCATFEWEADWAASLGEANPDVYVKYIYEVRDTGLIGDKVRALDFEENMLPPIEWRDLTVWNCPPGPACDIAPGANLAITTSLTSTRAQRVNALDTAQRALQKFPEHLDQADGGVITMTLPCVPYDPATHGAPFTPHGCGGLGSAYDRSHFHIGGPNGAFNGRSAAHEIGHLLHFNAFNQDYLYFSAQVPGTDRRFDPQYQSLMTVEGWPDFVNSVSWWDESNVDSRPRLENVDIEDADPWEAACAGNAAILVQLVKGFWDLVDVNNEPAVAPASADDDHNTTASNLVTGLARFDFGTQNGQTNEFAGLPIDPNGMNAKDFYANNAWQIGFGEPSFYETLIVHQCLDAQDDN